MERNYRVDIIRCVGTLLVILAHVNIPNLLFQIRGFDVVSLVVVSGVSYCYSRKENYLKYIMKRIKRLVVPCYLLLVFLFLGSAIACYILGKKQLFEIDTVIASFFFLDGGIGYIWIVKVYLIMAILAPIFSAIDSKIKSSYLFFAGCCVLLMIQTVLINIEIISESIIFQNLLGYIIPYSVAYMLGMRFVRESIWDMKTNKKARIFGALLISFLTITVLIYSLVQRSFDIQAHKNPADFYYIAYGVLITMLFLTLVPNVKIQCCEYISRNSFSIYLVHIIVMLGYNMISDFLELDILKNWIIHYLIVITFSIALVWMINKINTRIRKRKKDGY